MKHQCPNCGKETEGSFSKGGILWAINECYKIRMVMDKDLTFDWLYAKAIQKVCDACKEKEKAWMDELREKEAQEKYQREWIEAEYKTMAWDKSKEEPPSTRTDNSGYLAILAQKRFEGNRSNLA